MNKGFVFASIMIIILFRFPASAGWQATDSLPAGKVEALAINPINGNVFAAVYGKGIYCSTQGGKDWKDITKGLPGSMIKSIAFNSKGVAFTGLNGQGVYRSSDNGQSWTESNNGLSNKNVLSISITENGNIYAATWFYGTVFLSTDNGASWTDIGPSGNDVHSVTADFNETVFACTEYNGIFIKKTADADWTNSGPTGIDLYSIILSATQYLYVGTSDGVYFSSDNGFRWYKVNDGLTTNIIRSMSFTEQGFIFAASPDGIFRMNDNGSLWKPFSDGLLSNNVFCLSNVYKSTMYAGTDNGVFFMDQVNSAGDATVSEFSLSVCPNPAREEFHVSIQAREDINLTIELFDRFGNTVARQTGFCQTGGSNNFVIRPAGIAAGCYYCKVAAGSETICRSIVFLP